MRSNLPPYLRELYSRESIDRRLQEMAVVVDTWNCSPVRQTASPLLAICVLRGGVFFFSDLLQQMTTSVEPAFCRAWSYTKGVNGSTEAAVRLDWHGTSVAGREIVLIDNICDSGRTLAVAAQDALASGALTVKTVTLVHRLRGDAVHVPTLAGFTYPGEEWLVGYGLRDGEALSNLPNVYRIVPTA